MADVCCITTADIKELNILLISFKQKLYDWINVKKNGYTGIDSNIRSSFNFIKNTSGNVHFTGKVNIDELVSEIMGI